MARISTDFQVGSVKICVIRGKNKETPESSQKQKKPLSRRDERQCYFPVVPPWLWPGQRADHHSGSR